MCLIVASIGEVLAHIIKEFLHCIIICSFIKAFCKSCMDRYICSHIIHAFCIRYREESEFSVIIHLFCQADLSGAGIEDCSCTTEEQVACGCKVYTCKSRLKISFCSKIRKKIYCIFCRLIFTKGICSCLISLDKFRTCYSPWREGKVSHKLPCIGTTYDYRNLT